MENKNLDINQIFDVHTIKELDSIPVVQTLVFGPKKHQEMIFNYNQIISGFKGIDVECEKKIQEIRELEKTNLFRKLFKRKQINSRIAVLENELDQIDQSKNEISKKLNQALKEIQEIEEEIKSASSVLGKCGIKLEDFISMYNKIRTEIIHQVKKPKTQKETVKVNQMGE